jgi:hypothetical protein
VIAVTIYLGEEGGTGHDVVWGMMEFILHPIDVALDQERLDEDWRRLREKAFWRSAPSPSYLPLEALIQQWQQEW